jgi:membrane protein implicated in regulation of membrane protease activity
VGFTLSVVTFALGALNVHVPLNWHLPSGWFHHGGAGHVLHVPHGVQAPHSPPVAGASHPAAASAGAQGGSRGAHISLFNFSSLLAFLAWFGGTGYLMTQYYRAWYLLGLGIALLSGLAAACVVSWFMVKVLLPHESSLNVADYEMVGVVARVNVPIRVGGTGEIIFSQGGARRSSGARSDDGKALEKGAEVVVSRYERGIAYVRRWEEWTQ